MDKNNYIQFKDYPEGSGGRKIYDKFNLSFQDYLNKYYLDNDLTYWGYINQKFITPLFDSTSWNHYLLFLHKAKPGFLPKKEKAEFLFDRLKNDNRFDQDIKHFFCFLYSIDFFDALTFEEWVNVGYWPRPWSIENEGMSIIEILSYENSINFLKERLSQLSIFKLV